MRREIAFPMFLACLLLLLPLVLFSSSSCSSSPPSLLLLVTAAAPANVDITDKSFYGDIQFSDSVKLTGTISANTTLTVSNVSFSPRTPAAVLHVDVTMGHNSSLILSDLTLRAGLKVVPRLFPVSSFFPSTTTSQKNWYYNSSVSVILKNCDISCSSAAVFVNQQDTDRPACPSTTTFDEHNPKYFAFLMETMSFPLDSFGRLKQVKKNETGRINLIAEDSSFSVVDDGFALSASASVVAFGVQNGTVVNNPANIGSAGQGTGNIFIDRLGQQVDVSLTNQPFHNVTIRRGNFKCEAFRSSSSKHGDGSPTFAACVSIGSTSRRIIDFQYDASFYSRKLIPMPGVNGSATYYTYEKLTRKQWRRYDSVGFSPTVLVDNVHIADSDFKGKCSGFFCGAVLVGEALVQRVVFSGNKVTFSECYFACGGVMVLSSYQDNFTLPVGGGGQQEQNKNASVTNQSSQHPLRVSPNPQILVTKNSFDMSQTTSAYSYADGIVTAIALRCSDFKSVKISANNFMVKTRKAKGMAMSTTWVQRTDDVVVDEGNMAESIVADGLSQNVAFLFRSFFDVKRVAMRDIVIKCHGKENEIGGVGIQVVYRFESYLFENVLLEQTALAGGRDATAGFAIGEMRHGDTFIVRNVTYKADATRNAVLFFFNDAPVDSVNLFLFANIKQTLIARETMNIIFLNSSLSNVSKIHLVNFSCSANPQPGQEKDARAFVVSTMMSGAREFLIENGVATCHGSYLCGVSMLIGIQNDWRRLGDSGLVFKNLSADFASTSDGGGLFAMALPGHYGPVNNTEWFGSALEKSMQVTSGALVRVPEFTLIDVKAKIKAGFLGAAFVGQQVKFANIILRGCEISGVQPFMQMLQSKAEIEAVDASGPKCSTLSGTRLYGRSTIFNSFKSAKIQRVRARFCGDTFSQSVTVSDTWYEIPKPSRTETNRSFTATNTSTRTRSKTVSLLPPELDLSAPAAASAVGSFAATTSLVGGAGASVALDAARAVALLSLQQQCASYRKADYGLSQQERRIRFYDAFLKTKPGFPQKVFWFICFGDERGACIRGAIVSHLLTLAMVVGLSFLFGKKLFDNLSASMSPIQKGTDTFLRFARLPFFLGMTFAFLIGPWSTQAIVLLSVPHLPDSDGILGVISVLIWFCIISSGLYIFFPRTNAKPSVWHMEESLVFFDTRARQRSDNNNNNNDDTTNANSNDTFGTRLVDKMCQLVTSDWGRTLFLGKYCWTEVTKDGTPPMANGKPGSMLWNCGTIINAYMGPYYVEQPLERRSKKRRQAERRCLYTSASVGGVATRKYHHCDIRLRVATYSTFINLFWSMTVCIAQGIALSDPEQCTNAATAMGVINICAFVCDLWMREFIVDLRSRLTIAGSMFLASASAAAAFGDPEETIVLDVAQTLTMIFLVCLLLTIACNGFLKVTLFLGKGTLLLRSELLRRFDAVMELERELTQKTGRPRPKVKGGRFVERDDEEEEEYADEEQERAAGGIMSPHHQHRSSRRGGGGGGHDEDDYHDDRFWYSSSPRRTSDQRRSGGSSKKTRGAGGASSSGPQQKSYEDELLEFLEPVTRAPRGGTGSSRGTGQRQLHYSPSSTTPPAPPSSTTPPAPPPSSTTPPAPPSSTTPPAPPPSSTTPPAPPPSSTTPPAPPPPSSSRRRSYADHAARQNNDISDLYGDDRRHRRQLRAAAAGHTTSAGDLGLSGAAAYALL